MKQYLLFLSTGSRRFFIRDDRNPFKKLFFTLSFLFLTFFTNAQNLHIVKDNINCTYGLKDSTGNWIVEPTYILIQEYNSGYFHAKDVMGDGLLSPTGKQIIACKYDQLDVIEKKWQIRRDGYAILPYPNLLKKSVFFQAKLGDEEVILNSRGHRIYTLSANDKVQLDGEAHILIYAGGSLTSTYLDTSGNVLINKVPGAIFPFGENEFSLHGNGTEAYGRVMQGDVRLITRKGDYPLNKQFERAIFGADGQICFEENSKYGEMTTEGKMLIAPEYRRKVSLQGSPFIKNNWVIYSETGKEGLMKPDGTILLTPIYDEIKPPHWSDNLQKHWLVSSDGLKGVVDYDGKTILPVIYDEITLVYEELPSEEKMRTNFMVEKDGRFAYINPVKSTNPTTWYDNIEIIGEPSFRRGESIGIKLIVEQNEKLGMLNLDGSVFSECIYDRHTQLTANQYRHFFSKGLEVVEFNFSTKKVEPIKWSISSSTDKAIIFTNPPYFITATLAENKQQLTRLIIQNTHQEIFGNMMILSRPENADWEIINIETQEKIEIKYIAEIKPLSTTAFQYTTRYKEVGILDVDGNVIVKPFYWEFKQNYKTTHLWARIKNSQWILIDEHGNQLFSDTVFQTFPINQGDIVRTVDGKTGILDTDKLEWKIEPKYTCLFKSVGDFYIAAEGSKQKGIVRSDGTVLLPLEYQSIQVLTTNCKENYDCKQGENLKVRWLARSRKGEILVDQKGQIITSSVIIRAFKEAILFADSEFIDPFEPVFSFEMDSDTSNISVEEKPIRIDGFVHHQTTSFRSYPNLTYGRYDPEFARLTDGELSEKHHEVWKNSPFKSNILDSIDAHWNCDIASCTEYYSRGYRMFLESGQQQLVTVQSERYYDDEFKKDCSCAQQSHQEIRGYGHGARFYQLETKGPQFASIAIGLYGDVDDRYLTMSQTPPPPPAPEHISFVVKDGKAISINLNDIFTSKSLLLEEFIVALQLRDDLKLDCSNLENMIELINGKFSLSKEGVHLYYPSYEYWENQPIRFLIPLERLNLHSETKWLVPVLKTE